MIIRPIRHNNIVKGPRINFNFLGGDISVNSLAVEKTGLIEGQKIIFDIDESQTYIKLKIDSNGFVLGRRSDRPNMLRMSSKRVCEIVKKYFANDSAISISFLVGTNEDNEIDLIINSRIVQI